MNASDLLQVWEIGQRLPPLERLFLLLASAGWQDAGSLTLGRKNRALLTLRQDLFGPQMECVVLCPHCAARLEFTLSTTLFLDAMPPRSAETLNVEHDAYVLTVRQPLLRDLKSAVGQGASLYAQCLLEAHSGEKPIAVEDLPGEARQEVAIALQEDDPLLNIQLALKCSNCGELWRSTLDVMAFLWKEIEQWGQRMLRTVHRLASAYGWSESEILALSAWRRKRYLEILDSG
jgi:hypothetical protein